MDFYLMDASSMIRPQPLALRPPNNGQRVLSIGLVMDLQGRYGEGPGGDPLNLGFPLGNFLRASLSRSRGCLPAAGGDAAPAAAEAAGADRGHLFVHVRRLEDRWLET